MPCFFVGSADFCLYRAGLPFLVLRRPARCPHAVSVGKCPSDSNPQTHGWAQVLFYGLRIRSLSALHRGHGKLSCKYRPQLQSVIFYPIIPIYIAISVCSKSLSEPITPLPCLNEAARWPVAGIISPHAAPGSHCHQKKPSPAGDGFFDAMGIIRSW